MIVYQGTKKAFSYDVEVNQIEVVIHDFFKQRLNISTSKSEIDSWKNSMQYMNNVLRDPEIPDDCNVAIEYRIPQSSKRIDFILTGQDENKKDYAILIELKQWEKAHLTDKDAVIKTYIGKGLQEVSHPSYQAWSYAALLNGFNEAVYSGNIQLQPCAFLHNYFSDGIIDNSFYQYYIDKAPVFLKPDIIKLRDFIKKFVKYGDKSNVMYRIESGKIKPSKSLADSLASMLKGNEEFVLIDDQKIIFETGLALAKHSSTSHKNVFIVVGGPGTGKTVVAVNLLVHLTKFGLLAQYITKNAAPRAVYESKLTGSVRKSHISNMFKGSGGFHELGKDVLDVLIVDEAHRLNEKSGLFSNLGENQIKEIINAGKCSIFFIDEDQQVTLKDIGRISEIRKWADIAGAKVYETELTSQFRCSGSDGYLAWLDHNLQIRETANDLLNSLDYEFKVFGSPSELRDAIFEKNKIRNKARMVAGYCWDWASKKDPDSFDIEFRQYEFKMRWNLSVYGSLWLIDSNSVSEIGCIHTCQGLELDYIGVIIGPDLVVRNGEVITDVSKRSRMDNSIKGYKQLLVKDKDSTIKRLDAIVKNTYRTLMTRGLKGCYLYCTDKETEDYFRSKLRGEVEYFFNNDLTRAAEE
jgi:DUF2075 family protein